MEPSELRASMNKAQNLPSPPQVATQVLELARKEDVDLDRIAEVIEVDPALVSKLLRVANSPLFGTAREVQSLRQALMILGLRTVNVLVLGFSLVRRPEKKDGFDYDLFWRSSIATAVTARILAKKFLPRARDEAFVAGLLLDIGVLAGKQTWPEAYREVVQQLQETRSTLYEAEQRILSTDHMEVGGHLLRSWNLPELLCDVVEHHHRPGELPADRSDMTRQLTRLVEVAHAIGRLFRTDLFDPSDPLFAEDLQLVHDRLCNGFACGSEAMRREILEEVRSSLTDAWSTFQIEAGNTGNLEEIQRTALELMARLSLGAALDLEQSELEAKRVEQRTHHLEQRNHELATKATTDALTGLSNRYDLDRRLNKEHEASVRDGKSFGLLMLDLDRFKSVNDTHGHPAGDEVLRAVGAVLSAAQGPGETFGRFGGEEFCCVLPNASLETVTERAEQIRSSIADLHVALPSGTVVRPTVSIGGVWIPAGRTEWTVESARAFADARLYDSKHSGRNRSTLGHLTGTLVAN